MSKFDDIFSAAKQQPVEPEQQPIEQSKPMAATPNSERRRKKAINWDELIEEREATKRLNLDIPESTDKRLAARAKKLRITKAALVRRLIDAYLENIE